MAKHVEINYRNIIGKLVFIHFIVGKNWGNWYTLTLLATVTLVLITAGAEGKVKDTVDVIDRVNYGTVFKREQDMLISREFWLHTFHIPLPKRFKVSKIPTCMDSCNVTNCNIDSTCQMLQVLVTQIHGLHQGVLSNFNETMKTIRRLIPESKQFGKGRNTRSLLPFIGKLARGLFGTATMDDVNIMASHINEIAKKTNGLVKAIEQHGKHLSSFISITDKRMTNLMSGIKANNKQISVLTRVVNLKLVNLQYSILNITNTILNQVEKANILRSRFSVLELAVQDLVEGKITPHLIDRPTLTRVLHHLHSHIRKSFKQFYLTHRDPNYYYANAKFVYARKGSQLYVTVKFPLSSLNKPLNLYKVISLPVPVKDNSSSTMHATQLHSLPDYFAITPHHDHYLQLSSKDLVNCQHDSVILCDMNLALTPITVPDCTMALFSNNPSQIKKVCDFRFTQSLLKPNIIELTATSALVYNSGNLVLNCPKEQTIVPGCTFCVVHIPCRCSLSTDTLYFLPRLVDCYNSSETMTMVHPVNLALLQEFFDETKLMNIFGDTTFPKPINLSVPEFQFYNHSFSSIVANDQKAHLSLKKIAKAVKNDQKIFKTLAEPLIDGVITISADWPDLNAIIAFSSLGAATLAIVLCIYMFCKMRKMATALYVLQQVQTVTSSTVPSFIYNVKPKGDQNENVDEAIDLLTAEFSWVHASLIVGIVVVVIICIILYILCRLSARKGTTLALELTSGGDCVIVPISQLSLCPSYYSIPYPVIRDISVNDFPSLSLVGTWSPFTVTDKRTGKTISMPSLINLNIFVYFRVRKILKQPFSAYILLLHNNYAFPLSKKPICTHLEQLESP